MLDSLKPFQGTNPTPVTVTPSLPFLRPPGNQLNGLGRRQQMKTMAIPSLRILMACLGQVSRGSWQRATALG